MRRRSERRYRPELEGLEPKQALSAIAAQAPFAHLAVSARGSAFHQVRDSRALPVSGLDQRVPFITGITMDRITNPMHHNQVLIPPFQHVLVQSHKPVPGQVYNLLFLSVWNGTGRTFDASSGLAVRISNQTPAHAYPILTGNQQWRPGQRIVFYLLTKKYYPLSPEVTAGFVFNFVNSPRVVAIPGPSGIFLRLRYNPATFDRVLDSIVITGPGSRGHQLGIADTAIWEIIPAHTVIPL